MSVKPMRATIVDVARVAGVSTMTVSRVMRKQQKVSAATRKKVENAISSLGYEPNLAARALVGTTSSRICLLYGNPSSAYLGELMLGAVNATSKLQAKLIVEQTDVTLNIEDVASKLYQDWDALIVPPPMSDLIELRNLIKERAFPAVFLSSALESKHICDIKINDYQAAFDVTQMLLRKNHKRIGFIQGDHSQTASERRLMGYKDALLRAGISVDDEYITQGDFTYKSGEKAAHQMLSLPNPPSSIFASNDDMAAGAIAAAMRKGIHIPDQLAIVGFDDSAIASIVAPALSTVKQPVSLMAEYAVQQLVQSKQEELGDISLIIPHQIMERETS